MRSFTSTSVFLRPIILASMIFFSLQASFSQCHSSPSFNLFNSSKLDFPDSGNMFFVQPYSDSVFLYLLVKGNQSKCFYVFERSVNGSDFEIIDVKDGVCSHDDSLVLAYTAVDSSPLFGFSYYRVSQIHLSDDSPWFLLPYSQFSNIEFIYMDSDLLLSSLELQLSFVTTQEEKGEEYCH